MNKIYGFRRLDTGKPLTTTYIPAKIKQDYIYNGPGYVSTNDSVYFMSKQLALAFFEAYMCTDSDADFGSEFVLTEYSSAGQPLFKTPAIYITRCQMPTIYISEEEEDAYTVEKTY